MYFTTASWGPSERKNPGALGTCPVCPLVKTALGGRLRREGFAEKEGFKLRMKQWKNDG